MSGKHDTNFQGDILAAIRQAVEGAIADSRCEVDGGNGHYTLVVTAPAFAGLNMLKSQRLVYAAIAPLMAGDAPPIHAVDSLQTRAS
jgi:acid stress-induced BolA-like protein IbaG/YrbA